MLEISPFPALINLKEFIGGKKHCVTVFGKCIFDSNIPFVLLLTRDYMDQCCTNIDEKINEWLQRRIKIH